MGAMTRPIILEVTARWREDQPGGFAVNVTFDTPKHGEHFARQLLVAIEGLDRDRRWSPDVAMKHLNEVGRMPEKSRDETIRRRAVGIVAWLQERGHLIADEHNGVAWHRSGETAEVTVVKPRPRSAPPTEPTLKVAMKVARPRSGSRRRARPAGAEPAAATPAAATPAPAKKKARKPRKKKDEAKKDEA
jgi:hypothetical protein